MWTRASPTPASSGARAMHDDPSDADRDVAVALRNVASPWPSASVVDTSGTVSESVASAVRATAAGAAARRTSREVSTEEVWP